MMFLVLLVAVALLVGAYGIYQDVRSLRGR